MRVIRKKFKKPKRPWDSSRMEEEKKIMKEYGLRKKRELWRAEETVRNFRRRARDLIAIKNPERIKILLDKLCEMGLLEKGQKLEDVLRLKASDLLNRRIQTIVYRTGLSPAIKKARQDVVHGHVKFRDRKVTFPSFQVPAGEEGSISMEGSK